MTRPTRKRRKSLRELSRHDWAVLGKLAVVAVLVSPLWAIEAVLRFGAWLLEKWNACGLLIEITERLRKWAFR